MAVHETAKIQHCEIGEGVYIGDYCIVGDMAENRETWGNEPVFGVEIKDGAILAKLVTVDAGTIRNTVIGKRTMLMAHSHVGHDALIGEDVTIACGAKVGGLVVIEKGCNIGLNAVIHPRQHIPPYCMIGAGSVVTKTANMKPFGIWCGNPARFLKFNQRAVEKHNLSPEQVTKIQEDWLDKNSSK